MADMREALADPVFGTAPPIVDIQLVTSNAPNLARRSSHQERLAQLNEALGREAGALGPLPWEEVPLLRQLHRRHRPRRRAFRRGPRPRRLPPRPDGRAIASPWRSIRTRRSAASTGRAPPDALVRLRALPPKRSKSCTRSRSSSMTTYSKPRSTSPASATTPPTSQSGFSCRKCERRDCHQRAVPPLNRPLEVDFNEREVLPYRIG